MSVTQFATDWISAKKRKEPGSKMTPAAARALVDFYEGFLRVGRIDSLEWIELDAESKACALAAQKRIDVERALMMAQAIRGGAEDLVTEVDGGRRRVGRVIDEAIQRYIEKQR